MGYNRPGTAFPNVCFPLMRPGDWIEDNDRNGQLADRRASAALGPADEHIDMPRTVFSQTSRPCQTGMLA
jgi:hypothetical protein